MIYILEHYYYIDHKKNCLVVSMDRNVDKVIEICSSVQFLLEDTVDVSIELDEQCLLSCLEKFYDAHDVKSGYNEQFLNKLNLPIESRYQYLGNDTYIIDLYEAREYCFVSDYKNMMNRYLPKGEQFIQMKNIIQFNNPSSIEILVKRAFDERYPAYKDEFNVSVDFPNNKFIIEFRGHRVTDTEQNGLAIYGFNGCFDEKDFYLNLNRIFLILFDTYKCN